MNDTEARLRRLHRIVGWSTFAAFIATGVYMRLHHDVVISHGDGVHVMFTSRHIYILATAIAHLLLSSYLVAGASPRARRVQFAASILMTIASMLAIGAFLNEPMAGRMRTPLSALGIDLLTLSTALHIFSAPKQRARESSDESRIVNVA